MNIDWTYMRAVIDLPGNFRVVGDIQPDSDGEAPWEWGGEGSIDILREGGMIETNDDKMPLDEYIMRTFGRDPEPVYRRLVAGEIVHDIDGCPCLGIEAYIHSGEVWYLPGGCSIDRQWDVVPLRAIWTADDEVLANLGEEPTAPRLREYLSGCLKNFNQYLSGDVWGVSARLERLEEGEWRLVDEGESLWGLYGEEAIADFMQEQAETFKTSHTNKEI